MLKGLASTSFLLVSKTVTLFKVTGWDESLIPEMEPRPVCSNLYRLEFYFGGRVGPSYPNVPFLNGDCLS